MAVYAKVDEVIGGRLEAYMTQTSKPIPCKPSCSLCCRGLVAATEAEGAFFAEYVRGALNPAQQEVVTEGLRDWMREMTAAGLIQQFCEDPKQYAAAGIHCPLLLAHNCLTYSMRPLLCRGHYALNAEDCAEWGNSKKEYPVLKHDDILGPATAEIARHKPGEYRTSYWQYWVGLHLGVWRETSTHPELQLGVPGEVVVPAPTVEGRLMDQVKVLQERLDAAREAVASLKKVVAKSENADDHDTAAGVEEVPDLR